MVLPAKGCTMKRNDAERSSGRRPRPDEPTTDLNEFGCPESLTEPTPDEPSGFVEDGGTVGPLSGVEVDVSPRRFRVWIPEATNWRQITVGSLVVGGLYLVYLICRTLAGG
mgnify:CR=1 FL=1